MPGLDALNPDEFRYTPPYGAHPILYEAVDEVLGSRFRQGPNGKPANKRRDDYLLGTALFIDTPSDEHDKTRVYFAATMIAQAPNRDVDTPTAPINNYRSGFDNKTREPFDDVNSKFEGVVKAFGMIEDEIEERLEESDVDKAEIVIETLDDVRSGQSFFARWGDAREETKETARDRGWGNHGL